MGLISDWINKSGPILVSANIAGTEKMKPMVIKKSTIFKEYKILLSHTERTNPKIGCKIRGPKTITPIDHRSAHPLIYNLTLELIYFSANTTDGSEWD